MQKRVLFIGNSFTYYNNMPCMFSNIVNLQSKERIIVDSIVKGGQQFENYTDPNDIFSKYVDNAFTNCQYDIVILQEYSLGAVTGFDSFVQNGATLINKAKNNGAKVYLYGTWCYGPEHEIYSKNNWTPETLTANLTDGYKRFSHQLNTPVSLTGPVALKLIKEHPEINLFCQDFKHPSPELSFTAALCLAQEIFNIDPFVLEYIPSGINIQAVTTIKQYVKKQI